MPAIYDDDDDDDAHVVLPVGPKAPEAWGDRVSVSARTVEGSIIRRLLLGGHLQRFYFVEQMSVDAEPVMQAGPIAGDVFSAEAFGVTFAVNCRPGTVVTLTVRAVKPPAPKIFAIAWWVRWFTREGWRDRTPRKPPAFQACFLCAELQQ